MSADDTGAPSTALVGAVREIEAHAHESGWDQPPRLYALVPTSELLEREPSLGPALGVDLGSAAGTLTPVEQEALPLDRPLEDTLRQIMWPASVTGCVAVLERVALPPHVEESLPADPQAAQEYAANHPERQDVRMAVGVSRDGEQHCVLRARAHGDALIQGSDLVPTLVRLLHDTMNG
ncbi:MAG: hypothetical protein GEU93_01755 [Propionibacteriales bacterium]|nr:hypothetical protein [Propionibacteriales bacterium]